MTYSSIVRACVLCPQHFSVASYMLEGFHSPYNCCRVQFINLWLCVRTSVRQFVVKCQRRTCWNTYGKLAGCWMWRRIWHRTLTRCIRRQRIPRLLISRSVGYPILLYLPINLWSVELTICRVSIKF